MAKDIAEYNGLSRGRLEEILRKIPKLKIALIGDICLDVYWKADMTKSVLSRETPHFPLPVVEEWMSPGAGGNTAANIAELGVAEFRVLSVIGNDWRGSELKSALLQRKIQTDYLIQSDKTVTNAYCKPLRQGISETVYEDPRLDFTNYFPLPAEEEKKLIGILELAAKGVDALCVCDQFAFGCITPNVRAKINDLGLSGLIIAADSRENILDYKNITIKPNELEGGIAAYKDFDPKSASLDTYADAALILSERTGNSVCMTLGGKGGLYVKNGECHYIPTHSVAPPMDICGAGDTFLSAFTCARATGAKGYEAVALANLASSVTVKKMNTTGTASPEEILKRHEEISQKPH